MMEEFCVLTAGVTCDKMTCTHPSMNFLGFFIVLHDRRCNHRGELVEMYTESLFTISAIFFFIYKYLKIDKRNQKSNINNEFKYVFMV